MRVITPGLMQRVEALLSRLLLLVCLRMEVGAGSSTGWHLGPGLGIAESRLTSQPKAAPSHEWAPPPATSHIPMPIVLYTQQRTRIPFIFPINQIPAMPVWIWRQTSVSEQIREVCKFSEIIGRAASGVSDYVRCVHGRGILKEKVAGSALALAAHQEDDLPKTNSMSCPGE